MSNFEGGKASREMQLYGMPFNYNVYTYHVLTVSLYSNVFRLHFMYDIPCIIMCF